MGWQRQENGASVQQAIEEAVQRFSGEAAPVFVAGRTDKGVHALNQSAHIDLMKNWSSTSSEAACRARIPSLRAFPAKRTSCSRVSREVGSR